MPPYVISDRELGQLCRAVVDVVARQWMPAAPWQPRVSGIWIRVWRPPERRSRSSL